VTDTDKYDPAKERLTELIEGVFDTLRDLPGNDWIEGHDEGWVAERLIEWFNREPDEDDCHRLLFLLMDGKFRSWDCPGCERSDGTSDTMCHEAELDRDEWRHFQGARQLDRVSYPGNSHNQQCCNHCRMYGIAPEGCPQGVVSSCEHEEECDCS
jgi:hypothetical protein